MTLLNELACCAKCQEILFTTFPISFFSLSLSLIFIYKDFMIMLVHHLATILLIIFSYTNNMIRCGTLVMCLHDVSDIFLEVKVHLVFNLVSPGMAADALSCRMKEYALPCAICRTYLTENARNPVLACRDWSSFASLSSAGVRDPDASHSHLSLICSLRLPNSPTMRSTRGSVTACLWRSA